MINHCYSLLPNHWAEHPLYNYSSASLSSFHLSLAISRRFPLLYCPSPGMDFWEGNIQRANLSRKKRRRPGRKRLRKERTFLLSGSRSWALSWKIGRKAVEQGEDLGYYLKCFLWVGPFLLKEIAVKSGRRRDSESSLSCRSRGGREGKSRS